MKAAQPVSRVSTVVTGLYGLDHRLVEVPRREWGRGKGLDYFLSPCEAHGHKYTEGWLHAGSGPVNQLIAIVQRKTRRSRRRPIQ